MVKVTEATVYSGNNLNPALELPVAYIFTEEEFENMSKIAEQLNKNIAALKQKDAEIKGLVEKLMGIKL